MKQRSVGVVVALDAEARALAQRSVPPEQLTTLGDGSMVWLSGMGQAAAHRAAVALADAGATALAVFGVAGALATGLHSGSLLCPAQVIDEHGDAFAIDAAWRQQLARQVGQAQLPIILQGNLLSLSSPLLDSAAKTAAALRYHSIAVDMESAAVAAVARARGLPLMVLRAIVDERDDEVPAALQAGIDHWGRPRPLGLVAVLARHPGLLVRLPGLATRMGKATRALRAAAAATGTDLAVREAA